MRSRCRPTMSRAVIWEWSRTNRDEASVTSQDFGGMPKHANVPDAKEERHVSYRLETDADAGTDPTHRR